MKSYRPYKRTDRVASEIKEILGKIQTHQIDLSDLGFITFSNVVISSDLKNAKIFFSVINNKFSEKKIQIELNKRVKIFRKYLAKQLEIKYIPLLKFYHDDTYIYNEKIDKIFSKIDIKRKN